MRPTKQHNQIIAKSRSAQVESISKPIPILDLEKLHLAELLEAVQRCVYFLDASSQNLTWPLTKERLQTVNSADIANSATDLRRDSIRLSRSW